MNRIKYFSLCLLLLFAILFSLNAQDSDSDSDSDDIYNFDFDISEVESDNKLIITGYLSTHYTAMLMDEDSLTYKLQFFGVDVDDDFSEYLSKFNLDFYLDTEYITKYMGFHMKSHSNFEELQPSFDIYEVYGNINFGIISHIKIGKIIYNWGKGYAFNTVGFANPVKNPEDPQVPDHGLLSLDFEIIKSFT